MWTWAQVKKRTYHELSTTTCQDGLISPSQPWSRYGQFCCNAWSFWKIHICSNSADIFQSNMGITRILCTISSAWNSGESRKMDPAEFSCPKGSVLKTEKESHINIYHSKKMPSTSRLIFSERVLRERGPGDQKIKNIEDREENKVWYWKVFHKLCLCQPNLTKRTASYLPLPEEKWDRVIRIIRQHCTRGTWGTSGATRPEHTVVLGLITLTSLGGKTKFLRTENSFKALAPAQDWFCQVHSQAKKKKKWIQVPSVLSSGSLRKFWTILAPHRKDTRFPNVLFFSTRDPPASAMLGLKVCHVQSNFITSIW